MATNEPHEEQDLDGFDSTAGVMAFIYAKEGAEGLKALLALLGAEREMLERDAQELIDVGLPDVAAIVAEAAGSAPSEAELCPFDPETDQANHWDWHCRRERDAKRATWAPLPDHLYGCCNGLRPGERPLNWDINRKKVLSSGY
jgi:hypothetical protein